MEDIKTITEVKTETIKGREFEVTTVKKPKYSEEEKEGLIAQLESERAEKYSVFEQAKADIDVIDAKLKELK